MEPIVDTPADQSTLLVYSIEATPSPIQVSTPLSLTITANLPMGSPATVCQQIVVTLPVGTNAADLIATGDIQAVPPSGGWTAVPSGGQVVFTPPGGSVTIKGGGLVLILAVTTNAQPGTANVLIDETASNASNPMAPRSTTWAAAKYPADFTLSALTAVPVTNTNIPDGSPAQLTWKATGANVTCTLSYVPDNAGTQISVPVPLTPDGPSFQTQPLTRSSGVIFYLTAYLSIDGQDEPITLQSQLPVAIETLSLNVTVQPPRIPPGGIAVINWSAPNATQCITKDGVVLPPSGTAYVVLQQSHDFEITAYGPNNQVQQAPTLVTVDPTIVANQPAQTVTGAIGATIQPNPVAINVNRDLTGSVIVDGATVPFAMVNGVLMITIDGVTRPPTVADAQGLMRLACPPSGTGANGSLQMALPPLDVQGTSNRVIPINVIGGTGGTGGSSVFTFSFAGGTAVPLQGPGCPGGQGGNANAIITPDPTQQPAQYIFTFTPGPGGAGGPPGPNQQDNGPQGAAGLYTALAFNGLVVPLDGTLVPPVPFSPLVLSLAAIPATAPMNGLALVRWNAPNADHCVLWDGSVAAAKGERYMVMTATTEFTVTAYDRFGRVVPQSATITVDPSIQPTGSGTSQTGATGTPGTAGACPSWAFNPNPPSLPTGWTAGGTGGTGGDATITLAIPPLDATGTSTRVIPITAIAGAGGPGGLGGWLNVTGLPSPLPDPFPAQFPPTASPGGPGGNGGSATVTLTTDHTQAPARIILQAAAGAGGAGGESGVRFDMQGNPAISYAANGSGGTAGVTVDGLPVMLPPATNGG